jgi:glucosamine kinase
VNLYAGIDGGQSSTTAVVGDGSGTILGRGTAGPADEVGCDASSTRLRDALEGALAAALDDAKLPRDARFEAVVAGVSGYAGATVGIAPAFNAADVRLMHDAPIAHAGALGGAPGVIVIAGTGSVVYGVGENGIALTAGGYGYLFGDEGSAFSIGRGAISFALRDEDDGCQTTGAVGLVRSYFGVDSPRQVQHAFYAGRIARDEIAAFARAVLERDDLELKHMIDDDVTMLAQTAFRLRARLGLAVDAPVAVVGGLSHNARYLQSFEAAVEHCPLNLVPASDEPVVGALLLALAGPSTSLRYARDDKGRDDG